MLAVSRFPLSSSTPCSAFSSGFASMRSGVTAVSKREEGAKAPPPRLLRGADYQQKVSRFIAASIFIASMDATAWPTVTRSPGAALSVTTPENGAAT
ncbi:MAG: hypothetical protein K0R81_1925 [Microbacterium sp.]|nr:hypothetical protein [Microbacterium sp.]